MCLQPSCDPAEKAAAVLTEILNMPDLKAADEEILRIPTGPTGGKLRGWWGNIVAARAG